MSFGVVIPYFQHSPGILSNALSSIFSQIDVDNVSVVVVDDESPVSAASELAGFSNPRFPVTIVKQGNRGPAAARNRGLDALRPDVRYVAFLDSDDVWLDDHLANASIALAAGHDFFFADFFQPGQTVSAFARAGRLKPEDHPRISNARFLHRYVGDMFGQIVMGNIIGTPTVVYDFARFRSRRFEEEFVSAGEDYLFWIACARAGARFAFSSKVAVKCGFGVNVYSGSVWGTDGHLLRVHNELKYRKRLATGFELDAIQRRFVTDQIRKLRAEFVRDVLHRLAHRKRLPVGVLKAQFKLDPATFVGLPAIAGRIVMGALTSQKGAS